MKRVLVEPEWFKLLAKDAGVSSKDIAILFGFKDAHSVAQSSWQGSFPKPDFYGKDMQSYDSSRGMPLIGGNSRLMYWRPATLRAEIKRRNAS